ncbi:MAG: hypothetical protein HXX13_14185 [Bacteroidetes bacterium]|nr:hypothetical protein [Bacteroidota bacterium]
MESIYQPGSFQYKIRTAVIDCAGILLVLLVPAAAHLTRLPVYFLEPMRIMMVIGILYTSRSNTYLLAIALPLFSFLFSGHPFFIKMLIIISELSLNVLLYFYFIQKLGKPFLSMFLSILGSKIACYLIYWVVFSWAFVVEEGEVMFLLAQLVVTTGLSMMVWKIGGKEQGAGAAGRRQ